MKKELKLVKYQIRDVLSVSKNETWNTEGLSFNDKLAIPYITAVEVLVEIKRPVNHQIERDIQRLLEMQGY